MVLKTCAFDRKKRYHDVREMNQALEIALQGKWLQPGRDRPATTRQGEDKAHSSQSEDQRKSDTPLEGGITTPLVRDAEPPPRQAKPIKRTGKGRGHSLMPLIVAPSVLLVVLITVGMLWVGGVIDPYAMLMPTVTLIPSACG